MTPLSSRTFLTELKMFVTSLAVLAFHLTLLLNCSKFGGFFWLRFFPPSLELGLLMLMSQISSVCG